jgi:hypothetical protein
MGTSWWCTSENLPDECINEAKQEKRKEFENQEARKKWRSGLVFLVFWLPNSFFLLLG